MLRAGFNDTQAPTVLDGEIHRFAAYYLAFTDYFMRGVPRWLRAVPPTDIRAFLSYSSADKEYARRLAHALDQEAIKVWLDERELRIGDSLWDSIGAGIDSSTYLLILISPRSVASPWVRRELNAALSLEIEAGRKVVLPVVAEETKLPVILRERLYCDLSEGFEQGVAALVQAMA
jgi:TIR domain